MTKNHTETSMLPDDFEEAKATEEMFEEPTSEQEDTPNHEEEVDTTPETSEEDTKEEPTQVDSYTQLFNEMELGKSFKDPADALTRIPEMQRYITQTRQELAEMKKSLQTPKERPNVSPDEFYEKPTESLEKLGYVPADRVGEMIDSKVSEAMAAQRAADFQRRTADFEEHRPKMVSMLDRYPYLNYLPIDQAYEISYQLAKFNATPKKSTEVVKPSPKGDPNRAQTSGGKPTKAKPEPNVKDMMKMGIEELEEKFGFSDE